jgi:hypothetical protein
MDSRQLLIVGPCYLNEHKQVSSYEGILKTIGFPYKRHYANQLKYDSGNDELDVVFSSGLGDVVNKVYGKMKNYRKLGIGCLR